MANISPEMAARLDKIMRGGATAGGNTISPEMAAQLDQVARVESLPRNWEMPPEEKPTSFIDRLLIDAGAVAGGLHYGPAGPIMGGFDAALKLHPSDPLGAQGEAMGEVAGALVGALPLGPALSFASSGLRGALSIGGSGLAAAGAQTLVDQQWQKLGERSAWAGIGGALLGGTLGAAEGALREIGALAASKQGLSTLDEIAAAAPGKQELTAFLITAADNEAKLSVLQGSKPGTMARGLVGQTVRSSVAKNTPITVTQWKALPIEARVQYMLDAGVEEDVARKLAVGAPTAPFVELRRLGKAPRRMPARAPKGSEPPLNEQMGQAAREAFLGAAKPDANGYYSPAVLGAAKKAASIAARASGKAQINEINNQMQALAKLRDLTDPRNWRSNVQIMWDRGMSASRDMLSRQMSEFGTGGKPLAIGLGRQDVIADRLAGEWETTVANIEKLLGEDLKGLQRFGKGEKVEQRLNQIGALEEGRLLASEVSPQVVNATKLWGELRDTIHLMGEQVRLRQDYAPLSRAAAGLQAGSPKAFAALKAALSTGDASALRGEAKALYDAIRTAKGEIVNSPSGLNVLVPALQRKNYVPHYVKPEVVKQALTPGTALNRQTLDRLKRLENITDDAVAQAKLREYFVSQTGAPSELRGGSLQWSRDNLFDPEHYEQDFGKWARKYVFDASRRIAGGEVWGGKDELAQTIFNQMQREGGNVGIAKDIWRAANGMQMPSSALGRAASKAADIWLLSPGTALLQFFQLSNTAALYGYRNTIKGVLATMRSPELRDAIARSGATLPDATHAIAGDPFSETSSAVLRAMGITGADRTVRFHSAVAGSMKAGELVAKTVKRGISGLSKSDLADMQFMNMPAPQTILEQGGRLSPEQLKQVMLAASNKSQFASHVSDLPWLRTKGDLRLAYKFKTFSIQQGTFIKELWNRGYRDGNWAPLLRYAAALGVGSQTVIRAREMMKRNPKDQAPVQLMIAALTTGALGAVGDAASAASETGRLGGYLMGPAVGLIEKPAVATTQLGKGDVGAATRTLLPNSAKNAINLYENLNK